MSAKHDDLGDRMKSYEVTETGRRFDGTKPVYARIDGRGFSKFTKGMSRPYDLFMSKAMIATTRFLVEETHASIGYTQSDEISLTWGPVEPGGELFFDGKVQKMVSVCAGLASSFFTKHCLTDQQLSVYVDRRLPHFDCRVFELPDESEGTNAFVWRALDARKNAISMAARAFYSHKDVDGRSGRDKLSMLAAKGIDFNDYPAFFKHGTFLRRVTELRALSEAERARIPEAHRPPPDQLVFRSSVRDMEIGDLLDVTNRVEVIYHGAEPIFKE